MKSVLDTSVVLAPIPLSFNDDVAISVITLAELHFGVMVASDEAVRGDRLRRLSALQSTFDPLPVDGSVAAAYGRLAAALAHAGLPPSRVNDLLISATALAHGAQLVTRRAADYTGLEDLVEIVAL